MRVRSVVRSLLRCVQRQRDGIEPASAELAEVWPVRPDTVPCTEDVLPPGDLGIKGAYLLGSLPSDADDPLRGDLHAP